MKMIAPRSSVVLAMIFASGESPSCVESWQLKEGVYAGGERGE
jgi:hypothetical protein